MRLIPKITDRYICREFFGTFAEVVGACAIVLLISRVFEDFDDMIKNQVPMFIAAKYFALMLPFRLLEVVPLATILSVIFSVGTLARNREMLAITSGGQSPYRSWAPVLVSTLGITFLTLFLNESFVPYCQARAEYYREVFINGNSELSLTRRRDIFDKGMGNTFFMTREFDATRNRMYDVLIFEETDDPKIWRYSLTASSAQLERKRVEPDKDLWVFERAIEHHYNAEGQPSSATAHTEPFRCLLEADLDQYLANRKEPEQMNLAELSQYVRTLKLRGEDVAIYNTDWYLKLGFPFATTILAMIGFALALRAHTASLPLSFGLGISLSLGFYALTALGQTLGHNGVLSPLIGALGPLVLFLGLGIYLIRRSGFAS